MSDGVRTTYAYDTANRLISVTQGVTTTQFGYNGDGDRVSQTINGVPTTYAFDPAGLTRVLVETTGGQSKKYVPGLAQFTGGAWAYQLPDGLGSVRQLTDPTGQISLIQNYDPFGNVLQQVGAASPFGYTGEQIDPTGLVFLRARYYNPGIGRFITPDSIIPDPLKSMGWNRYAYVGNNSVNYADPSGHCIGILLGADTLICAEVIAVGAAFVAAGAYVVTSPEFQNALNGAINSSSLSMLPGYGMFGPGTHSQQSQLFDPTQEFNQCLEARRLPGSIPSKRIPKNMPNLAPTGPPLPDPNQKPPHLDPDDEVAKLIKRLYDPKTPPQEKVLILVLLFYYGVADMAGLTGPHP